MKFQMQMREILDRALASGHGIALKLNSLYVARHYRRRFYAERERLRLVSNRNYDQLSFIIKGQYELWVIPRKPILPSLPIGFEECRALTPQESPYPISSRGRSRVGKNTRIS